MADATNPDEPLACPGEEIAEVRLDQDGDEEQAGDVAHVSKLKLASKSLTILLTHLPNNPFCQDCQMAKMKKNNKYTKRGVFKRQPDKFLDLVTADHVITRHPRMIGDSGEECAFVVLDVFSGLIYAYPAMTKETSEVQDSLAHFSGRRHIETFYTDGAPEIAKAAKDLSLYHETSQPGRHSNNWLAERTNQTVVGGTTATLMAAGVPPCFWSMAMPCFCVNYNASEIADQAPITVITKERFAATTFPF